MKNGFHIFISVTPAKAGAQLTTSTDAESWILAFAGMTGGGDNVAISKIASTL